MLMDDATVQRGIEEYLPKRPPKYPCSFRPVEVEQSFLTEQAREAARAKGENPKAVEPVYKTVDFIRIELPGGDCYDGPPTEDHLETYAKEFDAYKRGEELMDGFPLREWARMPEPMKLRCQLLNIFTMEQFCECPDTLLSQIGPEARQYRADARKFLGGQVVQAKKDKEAELKQQLEDLQAQMKELIAAQNAGKKGKAS